MGYSTGYFSEFGPFFIMVITQKFELRISSNFVYSIRTLIYRVPFVWGANCVKNHNKFYKTGSTCYIIT